MVASIGVIALPSQGVSYYEKDGYYARDDAAHKEASAWAGRGAEELGLTGPVDPDTFKVVLEGRVPDGPHLGKQDKDGGIHHRPGLAPRLRRILFRLQEATHPGSADAPGFQLHPLKGDRAGQ